jgi:hypothetical protein
MILDCIDALHVCIYFREVHIQCGDAKAVAFFNTPAPLWSFANYAIQDHTKLIESRIRHLYVAKTSRGWWRRNPINAPERKHLLAGVACSASRRLSLEPSDLTGGQVSNSKNSSMGWNIQLPRLTYPTRHWLWACRFAGLLCLTSRWL